MSLLKALYHERLLRPAAFSRSREILYPQQHWWRWIHRLLLAVGSALVLAGVFFFFAYNWSGLPPFAKFGLIETAMLGCAVGAWFAGLESLAGKACAVSAAILVGVFLAVFGMIYPTGAEAYTLFAAWAVLISAWVFIVRAPGLWFLWMALWNVTVWTFWEQGRLWWVNWDTTALSLTLTGLNALFLIFVEGGRRRGWGGLHARWLRGVLLVAIFGALIVPVEDVIFWNNVHWPLCVLAVAAVVLTATYYYFRYRAPDLFALAVGMLFCCVAVSSLLVRLFLDKRLIGDVPEAFSFLFVGMGVVGIFAVAVLALRALSRAMPAAASGDVTESRSVIAATEMSGTPQRNDAPTMRVLLDCLQSENLATSAERSAIETTLFKSKQERPTPWYVHAMIAFGAWLASICFFGFIFLIFDSWHGLREPSNLITIGIVWIGVAVVMSRTWEAIFFTQLALAMSAAGHAMVLVGIGESTHHDSPWALFPALASVVLCVILNPLYRTITHRFLSTALALTWLFIATYDPTAEYNLALYLLVIAETVAVGILFLIPSTPAHLRPVAFATALAVPANLYALVFDRHGFWWWWWPRDYSYGALNASLALVIAGFVWHQTSVSANARALRPMLLICVALLGLLGGAGLVLGMAMMALSYARRERELSAIGIATLVMFLIFYYYNLETSLLIKSLALCGGGALLLVSRHILMRRLAAHPEAA